MIFVPGEALSEERALTWVNRQGREERAPAPIRRFGIFSSGGGQSPRVIWSVPVGPGSGFVAGKPAVVATLSSKVSASYDVAPDGRFLFLTPGSSSTSKEAPRSQFVIVQHWFDELKARVPVSPRQD